MFWMVGALAVGLYFEGSKLLGLCARIRTERLCWVFVLDLWLQNVTNSNGLGYDCG